MRKVSRIENVISAVHVCLYMYSVYVWTEESEGENQDYVKCTLFFSLILLCCCCFCFQSVQCFYLWHLHRPIYRLNVQEGGRCMFFTTVYRARLNIQSVRVGLHNNTKKKRKRFRSLFFNYNENNPLCTRSSRTFIRSFYLFLTLEDSVQSGYLCVFVTFDPTLTTILSFGYISYHLLPMVR